MRDIMLEVENLTYRLLEIEKPESLTDTNARYPVEKGSKPRPRPKDFQATWRQFSTHKQRDLPFPKKMSNPEKQQQNIKFGKFSEKPSGSKQGNLFDRPLD